MKIKKGFKLFEMDDKGDLHALFIDKHTIMPINCWMKAGIFPTKGYSLRPGFHIGEICSAPWLMSANGTYKSQRSKKWKRVWAEVEYVADCNYTEEVKDIPGKCMKNELPSDGFYFFKEAGVGRIWIIADQMRITKILTEEERLEILKEMDYDEEQMFLPYKKAFEKRMKSIA